KAKTDVTAAEAAVNSPPVTSKRLEDANKAKAAADQGVIDKSAERGCRENCRQLLQAAVDSAAEEVRAARLELERGKAAAKATLETAKSAFALMKAPESPTPFADNIGMPPWAFSVMVVALGSVGINGLACSLMVYGTHHPRYRKEKPRLLDRIFARMRRKSKPADQPANVVSFAPKPRAADAISAKPMIRFLAQCVPEAHASDEAEWGDM